MKKHAKKLIAILLAMILIASVASVSVFSSAAALGEYTPSDGVETYKYFFAMPGIWTNSETEAQDNACGVYWWTGSDIPDSQPEANGYAYPGYKMEQDETVYNLKYVNVPKDVESVIINNYIDEGDNAFMTKDLSCGAFLQGDSDYYPLEFWNYIYDNYYNDFADSPDYQIEEFGQYAQNFSYNEDDDNIAHTAENMIYVIDPNAVSPSVFGNDTYGGAFYFYYGNGEFGLWPTKALLTSQEGVEFDDEGNLLTEDETLNEYGFVTRTHTDAYDGQTERDYVVYGRIDGEYWTNTEIPEPTTEPEVEPATISIDPDFEADPNKVYFQETGLWKNFKTITMYMYEHGGGDELIIWGSKKGYMTNEGNGLWSFDFNAKGITLEDDKQYGIIFTADWSVQSCDIIFDKSCLGDIAYCPGNKVENNVDSNKMSYIVKWYSADSEKYAPPVCITSIGNVIGEAYWDGDTPESIFTGFLSSQGVDGIYNAVKFNGKTVRQTAYDTGEALGLSQEEVEAIADEIGFDLDGGGYDPYDPTYDPYPDINENVYEAAEYILENLDNAEMITPSALKAKFTELEVTPDEVDEALYYICYDFNTYKSASEAVHKADSAYMDVVKGDVNNDGVVDIMDASWIHKLAVDKITSFDEIQQK